MHRKLRLAACAGCLVSMIAACGLVRLDPIGGGPSAAGAGGIGGTGNPGGAVGSGGVNGDTGGVNGGTSGVNGGTGGVKATAGASGASESAGEAGAAGSGGGSVCGNGALEAGETCDDSNTTAGDGCDANCALEPGFACASTPSVCNRSCNGLAKTCGPNGDQNCCASNAVPGGTFYRSYDGVTFTDKSYPATVSAFRLDNYEITVGRFRQFVSAYAQDMIPEGAGKNPNNPDDPGWNTAWNASLSADRSALTAALKCMPKAERTWTDSAGSATAESLPITCVNWYEAEAFCIWDGGRLPTEAEWNYAASGGAEQREFPWGSATPDASLAVFYPASNFAAKTVGSDFAGNGKWGQADLAGNAWEWVQDSYAAPYSMPCTDCAYLVAGADGLARGGSFANDLPALLSSVRDHFQNEPLTFRFGSDGARCAR